MLSLYRSGSLKQLIDITQSYKIYILAVQEMRWVGQSILEKKECTVYYSCHKSLHQCVTGFIINKNIRHLVIDFQPINMRTCKIRLRGRFRNYIVICAHAPTEERNENEDAFYDILEKTYENCPVNDIKMILGDLNAKVGWKESARATIGKFSAHKESNDNGTRGSTLFPHKLIHKATWRYPDGAT
jgi:hypothetical protein